MMMESAEAIPMKSPETDVNLVGPEDYDRTGDRERREKERVVLSFSLGENENVECRGEA